MRRSKKHKELNGISAEGYLAKAETLFREMALDGDLEQLDRVREGLATMP